MKTAIITGASRGIGREVAIKLAREGVAVALFARSLTELQALDAEIKIQGGKAIHWALDISEEHNVQRAVHHVLQEFGHIDILINNAGIGTFKPIEETSMGDWDSVMNTNVKGTFLLTKAVLPSMREKRSGLIISVASDVSRRTFANGALYCASKFAQDAFLSAIRKEVRKDNIRVSTIMPGLVDTFFHGSPVGNPEKTNWLKSTDIANAISYIVHSPDHVVIDELMLHPSHQDY